MFYYVNFKVTPNIVLKTIVFVYFIKVGDTLLFFAMCVRVYACVCLCVCVCVCVFH